MSASDDAFRAEARAWLKANAPDFRFEDNLSEDELIARSLAWQARKAEAGYGLVTAPPELGGRNGSGRMAAIFAQEEARFAPPTFLGLNIAFNMALPSIKRHGTPEQYRRFAKPTIGGRATWCQLFSEPSAGSDLAGLRTRAVREGDHWVVNGQKVWSTFAHRADYGILLARTDPAAPKHQGLTYFVVDMKSPGVEVRPIRQINGKSEFNATFLTDVVVPDANRIGEAGEGWTCALTVLMNERNGSGQRQPVAYDRVRNMIDRARSARRGGGVALDSTAVRARLAQWWVEEQGLRHFAQRVRAAAARGERPPAAVAMLKLVAAAKKQQSNAFLMDVDEYEGLFPDAGHPEREAIFDQYLWAAAQRIAGGTDEILRNQLAERVLEMPSEPRMDRGPFNTLPGGT